MKIVASAPLPEAAHRALSGLGSVQVAQDLGAESTGADVIILRAESLPGSTIERATSLRIIARTGVGLDNVDLAMATARGIPVIFAPMAGYRPVAEGSFALLMAAMKQLNLLTGVIRDGAWPRRYELDIRDLFDSTLGLIGYGRIGREVGRLASAFGMSVVAFDPQVDVVEQGEEKVELVDLQTLAERSDAISIHCSLNDSTRGLVDQDFLAHVRDGVVLVNASRGEVFADDQVILNGLASGKIGGLGLDVFNLEPLPSDHPFLLDPRVVCTPHAIGLTRAWNSKVFESLARDIALAWAGDRPVHVANPDYAMNSARGLVPEAFPLATHQGESR